MKSSKTPKPRFFFVLLVLFAVSSPVYAVVSRQTAVVEAALSGDTIRLKGGKELRYIGLESPPILSQIALTQQYGQDALEFNRKTVEGKTVTIEWGPQIRDKKNNLLGYVYLEDGTFVNRLILQNGHARAKIYAPNLQHAEEFREDELSAHRDKRGLWLKEAQDPRLDSNIWGDKVAKIYYYPNSPELDDVPQSQLVRFRSRVEAKAAGYNPCYSCRNRAAAGASDES